MCILGDCILVSSGFFVQLLSLNPEQAWEAFNDVGK
jgi:hypothetical protein